MGVEGAHVKTSVGVVRGLEEGEGGSCGCGGTNKEMDLENAQPGTDAKRPSLTCRYGVNLFAS